MLNTLMGIYDSAKTRTEFKESVNRLLNPNRPVLDVYAANLKLSLVKTRPVSGLVSLWTLKSPLILNELEHYYIVVTRETGKQPIKGMHLFYTGRVLEASEIRLLKNSMYDKHITLPFKITECELKRASSLTETNLIGWNVSRRRAFAILGV